MREKPNTPVPVGPTDALGDVEYGVLAEHRLISVLRVVLFAILILLAATVAYTTIIEGPRWQLIAIFTMAAALIAFTLKFAPAARPALTATLLIGISLAIMTGAIFLRGTIRIPAISLILVVAMLAGFFL